jgi:hypothetical protein
MVSRNRGGAPQRARAAPRAALQCYRPPTADLVNKLRAASAGLPDASALGESKTRSCDLVKRAFAAFVMFADALFPLEAHPLRVRFFKTNPRKELGVASSYLFYEALLHWRSLGGDVRDAAPLDEYRSLQTPRNTPRREALEAALTLDAISKCRDEVYAIVGACGRGRASAGAGGHSALVAT